MRKGLPVNSQGVASSALQKYCVESGAALMEGYPRGDDDKDDRGDDQMRR